MEIARKLGLGRMVVPGRRYPRQLPPELMPFYCYTRDGGHCVFVVLENQYEKGEDPLGYVVPAPVKTVLKRDYRLRGELVWCDIPYSKETGLIVDEEDYEY